jgi:hypothetical protein
MTKCRLILVSRHQHAPTILAPYVALYRRRICFARVRSEYDRAR